MSFINNMLGLVLFKITPIKKNRYVFTSYDGHYSDSPLCIARDIHEHHKDIEIIWLLEKKYAVDLPEWVKWYDIHSLKAEQIRGSAAALIDNVYCQKAFTVFSDIPFSRIKGLFHTICRNKRSQKAYSTWHGSAMKRTGRDQIGSTAIDFYCPNLTMILGNQATVKVFDSVSFGKLKSVLLGTPRNDVLLSTSNCEFFKRKLGLPSDKKVLLYAPTFRNDGPDTEAANVLRSGINQLNEIDFNILLEKLSKVFGGDWIVVCRFHYHVAELVDWNEFERKYPGAIINGNKFDDMADYLACTDVLMTDGSSCMLDYSLTNKPCFLFFPDFDYYDSIERGFYTPLRELPFPLAKNFEELINNIDQFDGETYRLGIKELHNRFGYVDSDNSSHVVAEYIYNETTHRQV